MSSQIRHTGVEGFSPVQNGVHALFHDVEDVCSDNTLWLWPDF